MATGGFSGVIGSLFGNRSQQPVQNNAPVGAPANPNTEAKFPQQNQGADPRNGVPASGNSNNGIQDQIDPAISPLEPFKDLWKTPDTKGKSNPDPFSQPLLTNDPAKFAQAASQMNFAQGIDPALVTKALAGDGQAFLAAINTAAQAAFTAAGQLGIEATEAAAKTNNSRMSASMDKRFREYLVKNERSESSVLNHPSAAPMVDLAKRQLMQQYPDKTPQDIQRMAEDLFVGFASGLQTEKSGKDARNTPVDNQDFSNYLNV